MSPPFEVFTAQASSRMGRKRMPATMTVTPEGRIILNANAASMLDEITERVVLLWNRDLGIFALRPAGVDNPNGYTVTRAPSGAHVQATLFVRTFRIQPGRYRTAKQGLDLIADPHPEAEG